VYFVEKMGMEASDQLIIPGYSGRRRKSHAHGAIVAATTPNLAAALSARHINTYVYVDK